MGPTRKEKRLSAIVPIRVNVINEAGEAVHCLAHTLNVSRRGARLAGVTVPLRVGMVVRLVRGRASSTFKVAWVGDKDMNSQSQIGVESLEVISNFWGMDQLQPVSLDEEHEGSRRRTQAKKTAK